jgi:hypothetical protein
METIDDIVFAMNIMLYAKEFDWTKFQALLNEIREKYHPKIGMLDLVYYNKVRKKELWDKKVNAVRNSDFELAGFLRRKEILGQDLLNFKKRFNIKRSIFRFEKNYLVYLHVGNARNDKRIKGIIKNE